MLTVKPRSEYYVIMCERLRVRFSTSNECTYAFILRDPHTVPVYNYLQMWCLKLRNFCHQNEKI